VANFYTHLSVSSVIGIVGATVLCGAGLISSEESLYLLSFCIFGGLLPDIDSDSDASINIIAKLFSGICAFLIMFPFISKFAILISLGLFVLSYLFIRFGILTLVGTFTQHRGIIHSLPSAVFVCFATSIILYHVFKVSINFAWLGAGFVLFGYLSHLVLDECFTQNLAGEPINRACGGAFQLISFKSWISFLVLYVILVASYFLTPEFKSFSQKMFSMQTGSKVEHHLFSGSVPIDITRISKAQAPITSSDIIEI
jgi:hypothetical protein